MERSFYHIQEFLRSYPSHTGFIEKKITQQPKEQQVRLNKEVRINDRSASLMGILIIIFPVGLVVGVF